MRESRPAEPLGRRSALLAEEPGPPCDVGVVLAGGPARMWRMPWEWAATVQGNAARDRGVTPSSMCVDSQAFELPRRSVGAR